MGLFDYVMAPFKCPYCGYKVKLKDWQTKAVTDPFMNKYKIGDRVENYNFIVNDGFMRIHTNCKKCEKYVSAFIGIKNGKLSKTIRYEDATARIHERMEKGYNLGKITGTRDDWHAR